ncbi:hypothetical protein ACG7TL_005187 [Trametes sanguinea]
MIRFIWMRKKTPATWLFFVIRYYGLLSLLVLQAISFAPFSDTVPVSPLTVAKAEIWFQWVLGGLGVYGFNVPKVGCVGSSDETIHEAIITCVHTFDLNLFQIDAGVDPASSVTLFSDPLTAILICRFLLDLHAANARSAWEDSDDTRLAGVNLSQVGSIRFASLAAHSMAGAVATEPEDSTLDTEMEYEKGDPGDVPLKDISPAAEVSHEQSTTTSEVTYPSPAHRFLMSTSESAGKHVRQTQRLNEALAALKAGGKKTKSGDATPDTTSSTQPPSAKPAPRAQAAITTITKTHATTEATGGHRKRPLESETELEPEKEPPPKKSNHRPLKNLSNSRHAAAAQDDDDVIDLQSDGTRSEESGSDADGRQEKARSLNPKAELKRLQPSWTAPIYAFFQPIVEAGYADGRPVHKFHCAAPGCQQVITRYLDKKDRASTSNLNKHVGGCLKWGERRLDALNAARELGSAGKARTALPSYLRSGTITSAFKRQGKGKLTYSTVQHKPFETRVHIVRWVARSLRPLSVVEDHDFKVLMKTGRPEYWIPSRRTVARDVHQVFAKTRIRVAQMLNEYEGDLNVASDCWTSPNHRAFMAITVHLAFDGEPLCLPLDLVEVPFSHTGEALASAFQRVLQEFGIKRKVIGYTGDNAANNDTMVVELVALDNSFGGISGQARCFLHTDNLAAKSAMHPFDSGRGKGSALAVDLAHQMGDHLDMVMEDIELDTEDVLSAGDVLLDAEDDEEKENVDGESSGEDDEDDLEDEDLTEEECADRARTAKPTKDMLFKLRKTSFAIIHSPTKLLPAWKKILEDLTLKVRKMPRDVVTRWNSTYLMVNFAIEYKRGLKRLTSDPDLGLRAYELTSEEWELAEQLRDLLKVFFDATAFFSSSQPNLVQVIPAMDLIDEKLATACISPSLHPSIQVAARLAKDTLNKYYSKTDISDIYRIAMILHPRYKLRYFKDRTWDQDWIEDARELTYDRFTSRYAGQDTQEGLDYGHGSDDEARAQGGKGSKNLFASFDDFAAEDTPHTSELDRYLQEPCERLKQTDDALKWWYDRRGIYPASPGWPWTICPYQLDLVDDNDVLSVTKQPAAQNMSPQEAALKSGWDRIDLVAIRSDK